VIFFNWDNMLDYIGIIYFYIIIALRKNVRELFNYIDIALFGFKVELPRQIHYLWIL
jgi:hypothetical protein